MVGSGVVRMQEGGVQEESEKSPVLPNTCLLVRQGAMFFNVTYPGYEGVLLAAWDLVTSQLELHYVVERGKGSGEGLHVGALVVDNVVVVKLKVIQARRPVKVLQPADSGLMGIHDP